ncbi:MAG: RecX family transcriptional regulator [Sphingomonadales bacterium]|nr:RecX family transcriptional regulator [Sphingomonadales bacterium]
MSEAKDAKAEQDGSDARLAQLMNYCARQERSLHSVRAWMERRGVGEQQAREWEIVLQKEGYVDQQRFAHLYARSKMRQKQWGQAKISAGLLRLGLSMEDIEEALADLGDEEYLHTLRRVAERKWERLARHPEQERRIRLMRFLLSRGYSAAQARSEAYRL